MVHHIWAVVCELVSIYFIQEKSWYDFTYGWSINYEWKFGTSKNLSFLNSNLININSYCFLFHRKICSSSLALITITNNGNDTTQSPNTNCQLWFGSYMKTKCFWVVFNGDLFLVPMHNLAGHIVKFTDYKKCWKCGLVFFLL